jgi:hypothetical protein
MTRNERGELKTFSWVRPFIPPPTGRHCTQCHEWLPFVRSVISSGGGIIPSRSCGVVSLRRGGSVLSAARRLSVM